MIGLFGAAIIILISIIVITIYSVIQRRISEAYRQLHEAQVQIGRAQQDIEAERRESAIKLKNELHNKRKEFELELKNERLSIDRLHAKLNEKRERIEQREQQLDELKYELQQKEREFSRKEDGLRSDEAKLKTLYDELIAKLEHISGMSRDDAKRTLLETLESEVRLANQKWIQKVEEEARQTAKELSIDIVATAMQRYTADQVTPHSSGLVSLPNDEMKGRVIGKEGRNIKALEMATGMEFVIGESPDITISGFNPIRREVARRTLEKLIADGRINPTRIEETVTQCEKDIDELIQEYGKETILEFNLQGVHSDIVTLLGKLHFRTSFSQNVLVHCKEVGIFARMIAEELGIDGANALRAGLFHDIGKAVSAEVEGPHAQIGADIAKRCGEDSIVVNGIAAHHEEVPFISVSSIIICVADAISASRPGARRETLIAYIKRLEKLEDIAHGFEGVKKAYALQAGREVRIIVQEDRLDDEKARILAHDIARRIEAEMSFPGQIKVNVIREKRSIEYAR
ncbi:MAG TPA: ribonuclease Y [Candidatus Babeliales bacterium]|jgi:ribonuclease Y|nr:ribonuclease Y [Candidatus Babeliales bacterium]